VEGAGDLTGGSEQNCSDAGSPAPKRKIPGNSALARGRVSRRNDFGIACNSKPSSSSNFINAIGSGSRASVRKSLRSYTTIIWRINCRMEIWTPGGFVEPFAVNCGRNGRLGSRICNSFELLFLPSPHPQGEGRRIHL